MATAASNVRLIKYNLHVPSGSQVTISAGGTYLISGSLSNGQIVVDAPDTDVVRLVLNGVDITSATGPAIQVDAAKKVILILADGTKNSVADVSPTGSTGSTATDCGIANDT